MSYRLITLIVLVFFNIDAYSQYIYNSTEEYFKQGMFQRTGFDESKVVFLEGDSFTDYIEEVIVNPDSHLFTYYGIVYNSELYSASELKEQSCWGGFLEMCKNIDNQKDTANRKVEEISYLKGIPFDKNKKTVVFIYANMLLKKRDVKKLIRPIFDYIKENPEFDYIVLPLDANSVKKDSGQITSL